MFSLFPLFLYGFCFLTGCVCGGGGGVVVVVVVVVGVAWSRTGFVLVSISLVLVSFGFVRVSYGFRIGVD